MDYLKETSSVNGEDEEAKVGVRDIFALLIAATQVFMPIFLLLGLIFAGVAYILLAVWL